MTRSARAMILFGLTVLVLLVAFDPRAGADAPREWGYWWKLQSGVGPVLSPPGVPDDGLWVAADPSGPQAISALRFEVPSDELPTSMTLHVAEAQGTPTLRACTALGDWSSVSAGAWDSRPADDCSKAGVKGRLSEDGTSWSFPVISLVRDEQLDVVIVPGEGTFSVAFDQPSGSTIASKPRGVIGEQPKPAPAPGTDVDNREERNPMFALPRLVVPQVLPAPPAGVPAGSLEDDVVGYPSPPVSRTTSGGGRPIALVALVVVAVAWIWRDRLAERAACDHELARPLALERDAPALRGAETLLSGTG